MIIGFGAKGVEKLNKIIKNLHYSKNYFKQLVLMTLALLIHEKTIKEQEAELQTLLNWRYDWLKN